MPSLLIFGEPDVGKTTILKKFMRGRGPSFDERAGVASAEVVAVEAPPEADGARFHAVVLDAIEAPMPGGRAVDLERGVHGQPRRLGTRLLVVDETNNLVIGGATAQRKTLAALRRLANQVPLSIAFLGTAEALNALTSDPQVEGRSQPFRPTRFRNDEAYATVVRSVVAHLPLRGASEVDDAFVDAVHDLTGGSPGKTFRLLNFAGVHAIDRGDERLRAAALRSDDVVRHIQTAGAMRRRARAGPG